MAIFCLQSFGGSLLSQCAIVIVNYNTGTFLKETIASVLSPAVASIVVVDNASTDQSLDLITDLDDGRLEVIRNPTNLGFGAGCNIGIRRVTSENILLVNPDCRLLPGAIERLIAALHSAERVGMVGPLLLNPDGSEQAAGRRKFPTPRVVLAVILNAIGIRRLLRGPVNGDGEQPQPGRPIPVEAISGACMMVRREAVADVGLLEESYFLHFEDLDWCLRFFLNGWTTLFVPDAIAVHTKGVSSRHHPFAIEYYKHRGIVRFYKKFPRRSSPHWLKPIVLGAVWLRFAGVMVGRVATSFFDT
jgi:GT2 family glycosyltransferase